MASWTGARFLRYYGLNAAPLDSQVLSASYLGGALGQVQISGGETQTGNWNMQANIPFREMMVFSYQVPDSGVKADSLRFDCGPQVPPGTAPPSIDSLAVPGDTGAVQPSDLLIADFTATSGAGIWKTGIRLSGACDAEQTFPSPQFPKKLTGSAWIRIPATCPLGAPLNVAVIVEDDGLQTTVKASAKSITLVDRIPPTLQASFWGRGGASAGRNDSNPVGIFFGGDSVEAYVSAWDNHILRDVVWEATPAGAVVKDSLIVDAPRTDGNVWIHLPFTATNLTQLRLYAYDSSGNVSDTLFKQTDSLHVYPTTLVAGDSTTVQGPVPEALPDSRRQVAYLRQPDFDRLLVLSLSTMRVTDTIALPVSPTDFDITPGGDSLVVALPDATALAVIDLRQSRLSASILPFLPSDTAHTQRPVLLRTLSNGHWLVSTSGGPAGVLVDVDPATDSQRVRTDAGDTGNTVASYLGRSRDHSVVVLDNSDYAQRYDVSTDTFGPHVPSPTLGTWPRLDATGSHVALGLYIMDNSLHVVGQADSVEQGAGSMLSPDGATLYEIYWDGTIVRARVSDGTIVDRILNPFVGIGGKSEMSDDGTLLMTTQAAWSASDPNRVGVVYLH